jgi:hypothetical protein
VFWLQPAPWARWLAAALILIGALWVEFRPSPAESHPFAVSDIAPGTVIDATNTEEHMVRSGLLEPVAAGSVARSPIRNGDPVLASDVATDREVVPSGWYQVELRLPREARAGDEARLVLVDTGVMADAVVTSAADDDPLGTHLGTVAVEPELADQVAIAVSGDRVTVLIVAP